MAIVTLPSDQSFLACAVCFGDPASLLTKGLNWGIGTLLVIVAGVLLGFAKFFWGISQRAKKVNPGLAEK